MHQPAKWFVKIFAVFLFALAFGSGSVLASLNIVLLGGPGAGKGTLAAEVREKYNLPHISSGDIVRAEIDAKTRFGILVADMIGKGQLLPDTPEFMGQLFEAVKRRLSQNDCRDGFILDGIPRTAWQAQELNAVLASIGKKVDVAVLVDVGRENLMLRLGGRLVCKDCRVSYHKEFSPPTVPGKCNKCCRALTQRSDDRPEAIENRLNIYESESAPVTAYYQDNGLLFVWDANVIGASRQPLFSAFDRILSGTTWRK